MYLLLLHLIILLDAPVVGIELYGNVTYTLMTLTLTENEIPDTIINCVSIGYPIPTVMWALNGNQSLPSGVIQNEVIIIPFGIAQ